MDRIETNTMRQKSKKNITKSPRGAKPQKSARASRLGITNEQIEQTVLHLLASDPKSVFNYKQVASRLGQTTMSQKRQVVSVLETMAIFGQLEECEPGRYRLSRTQLEEYNRLYGGGDKSREGTFVVQGKSYYFVPDGQEDSREPITVSRAGKAMSGDRVRVRRKPGGSARARRGDRGGSLEVVEIIERSSRTYVGYIKRVQRNLLLIADSNKELRCPIIVPPGRLSGANENQVVIVRVVDWPERSSMPHGEVVAVLGERGDNDTEMHAILAEFGLPYSYPEDVEALAHELSGEITPEELRHREDFRGVLTFTIDPLDAKDFDDALSIRSLGDGKWEVGVHIADVSHFVKPGSKIDEEAYSRATSIYLVDRTIPMLPEKLSNELCSLRPDEDKYSYSCVFDMTDDAQVEQYRIVRSVIRSQRRYTYEEAQDIIQTGAGDYADAILKLSDLAQRMRKRRFDDGAIAFFRPEVRFEIDEAGKPLSVYIKESLEAHQLIEEFMLLANKTVAERIGRKREGAPERPFVYRVHDLPDESKLTTLTSFASKLGYKLKVGSSPKSIGLGLNQFLSEIKGKKEDNLLANLAIRTMAKAGYTTDNIGHYGLAFAYYTHFTSPIRRYPDLMVHRLLTHYLIDKQKGVDKEALEHQCEHSSAMENLAAQAERASIRYKQIEYMQQYLGEEFEGVITNVSPYGLYVEIVENKCEGMVPLHSLPNDSYDLDSDNFALVGYRRGHRYTLGDEVRIKVVQTNLERKFLDFELV